MCGPQPNIRDVERESWKLILTLVTNAVENLKNGTQKSFTTNRGIEQLWEYFNKVLDTYFHYKPRFPDHMDAKLLALKVTSKLHPEIGTHEAMNAYWIELRKTVDQLICAERIYPIEENRFSELVKFIEELVRCFEGK